MKKNRISILTINILFIINICLFARDIRTTKYFDKKTGKDIEVVPGVILAKFKSGISENTIKHIVAQLGCVITDKIEQIDVYTIKIPTTETLEHMVEKFMENPNVEYAEPNYMVSIPPMPEKVSGAKVLGSIFYPKMESAKEYATSDGFGIRVSREIIYIPKEYGSFVSMVQEGKNTIIWFSDSNGTLRNIIVRDCGMILYELRIME